MKESHMSDGNTRMMSGNTASTTMTSANNGQKRKCRKEMPHPDGSGQGNGLDNRRCQRRVQLDSDNNVDKKVNVSSRPGRMPATSKPDMDTPARILRTTAMTLGGIIRARLEPPEWSPAQGAKALLAPPILHLTHPEKSAARQ